MKKQGSISALLKRNIAGIAPPSYEEFKKGPKKTSGGPEAFTRALKKKRK